MKIKVLYVLLLLLGLNQFAFSQTEKMSNSAKELAKKVREGDNQSILEAGKSGDKTLIPYLKTLVAKGSPWAQMALAKLGEKEYLNQILAEVDVEDPNVQDRAMEKLSYVGGKEAFKKFYQLLDDTAPRENPKCKKNLEEFKKNHHEGGKCDLCCNVVFLSKASTVVVFLSRAIENPPTHRSYGTDKEITMWKEWFLINKHLIEDY